MTVAYAAGSRAATPTQRGLGKPDGLWRTANAQAMGAVKRTAIDETCRQVLRLTAGGPQLRVRLSNAVSPTALHLSSVTVGLRSRGAAAKPHSLRRVTVGGVRTHRLAPGADAVSDPIALPVRAGDDLLVSFAVRGVSRLSEHEQGAATGYCSGPGSGDRTTESASTSFRPAGRHGFVVDQVSVATGAGAPGTILAIGDSLTDSTLPADRYLRWVDVLNSHLRGAAPVANVAIAGNRLLLTGGYGPTVLKRYARDVLDQPGVGTVVLFGGTNDISGGATAKQVTDTIAALIDRAHARGLRAVVVTIPPAHKRTADREVVRVAVNSWLRTTERADLMIDADALLRDPSQPNRLHPSYDYGDGLHLSVAGHRALGTAFAGALR